jgi:putative membrane protein
MSRGFMSSVALTALLMLTTTSAFAAKSPEDFIKDAIQGDNSEIMLGKLALDKGGSPQVREFGQMLVTDHSKAKEEAISVAKTLGVTPPDLPTTQAQDEQTKLSKLTGDGFDKEFASYMVTDHEKDIEEFQEQTKATPGPASDMAAKQLPTLQNHLKMAQAIAKKGDAAPAAMSSAPSQETLDQWRASKLAGVVIYGPDNKKVGTITDVLMSKEGKAEFVVIGVGGFLGIGEKDVAIPYDQVKFTEQPMVPPNATAAPANTLGGTTAAHEPSMAAVPKGSQAYPDHGMIDMTADQLKKAPTFHFAS